MKFSDLLFDKQGCCGTHNWSEILGPQGEKISIYDNGDATYAAVTMVGTLLTRREDGLTQAEVEAKYLTTRN